MQPDPDKLDRVLDQLADQHWSGAPRRGLFLQHFLRGERSRMARFIWLGAPLLLLLGACVTYGAMRHEHSFSTEIDVFVDGQSLGTKSVPVQVIDGRLAPVVLILDGLGSVTLTLELPLNVDPADFDGMRFEAQLSTDPQAPGGE